VRIGSKPYPARLVKAGPQSHLHSADMTRRISIMIARKQALLRIEDVVCVLQDEVRKAGSQAELARKTGVNRSNLNSTITGKRPPTNDILRALNLRKVFAYEKEAKTRGQEPLRIEGIVRIIRD